MIPNQTAAGAAVVAVCLSHFSVLTSANLLLRIYRGKAGEKQQLLLLLQGAQMHTHIECVRNIARREKEAEGIQ